MRMNGRRVGAAFADGAWPPAMGGARPLPVATGGFSFQIMNTLAFPSILEKLSLKPHGVTRGQPWARAVGLRRLRPASHCSTRRCPCGRHVALPTPWGPPFSGKLATPHPPSPRQGCVAPSQAGQPSRDAPGALACRRRAPRPAGCPPRASPPVPEPPLPRGLRWCPCLRSPRPSKTKAPDEKAARAQPPAVARGFRADSPDGSVGWQVGRTEVCVRRPRPAETP